MVPRTALDIGALRCFDDWLDSRFGLIARDDVLALVERIVALNGEMDTLERKLTAGDMFDDRLVLRGLLEELSHLAFSSDVPEEDEDDSFWMHAIRDDGDDDDCRVIDDDHVSALPRKGGPTGALAAMRRPRRHRRTQGHERDSRQHDTARI